MTRERFEELKKNGVEKVRYHDIITGFGDCFLSLKNIFYDDKIGNCKNMCEAQDNFEEPLVVDLNFLDVKKVQQKAIELVQNEYLLVIVGKPEHPEVCAIKANAQKFGENIIVAPNTEILKNFEEDIKKHKKVGVVVQTTQRIENLQDVVNYLLPIAKELKVFNTICASTSLRQTEAKKLAEESDLMVVVGGKNSANTTHLAEILVGITNTIHIETDKELDNYKEMIENAENIGVTAGASTPDNIINDVIEKLNKY